MCIHDVFILRFYVFIHVSTVCILCLYLCLYCVVCLKQCIVCVPETCRSEPGSIPLRHWLFLLIPIPIPELDWNWLDPVRVELELNWNCHYWNWSRNCVLRNCLHGIEIRYEVSHISVAYYSRRLAQVVYTLQDHIDSTKEIRGQLCKCSHNNETVTLS